MVGQCEQHVCLDSALSQEVNRGRKERRLVEVYEKPAQASPDWQGLQTVIKLIRSGRRQGLPYARVGYYISSLLWTAQEFSQAIRSYWHIENKLHWSKDVVFGEDASKIRTGNAAANLSIIRGFVISVFRQKGYNQIKRQQRLWSNKPAKFMQLLE